MKYIPDILLFDHPRTNINDHKVKPVASEDWQIVTTVSIDIMQIEEIQFL